MVLWFEVCGEFTNSLIFASPLVWVSVHLQGAFLPCSSDRVPDQDAKSGQNWHRNMTMLSIPRNARRLLETLKSNSFLRFLRSIWNLPEVNICTKISRRLVKKWHLLAFNQDFSSRSHCRTLPKAAMF